MAAVRIISPGGYTTIQDRGRFGFQHVGIPVSGVLDAFAFTLANFLVGNPDNTPVMEITVMGPSFEIRKEMDNFIKWHKAEKKTLHPLELASLVHAKLISMQPFVDGNSRLSRLLMNWILWKRNYPLVDIPIEDLEKYYDVLDKYQIERDEMPFIGYIKRKYLGTN